MGNQVRLARSGKQADPLQTAPDTVAMRPWTKTVRRARSQIPDAPSCRSQLPVPCRHRVCKGLPRLHAADKENHSTLSKLPKSSPL